MSEFRKHNKWAARLESFIAENPGCTVTDINRSLGVPHDTARRNLHMLEKLGRIHGLARSGRAHHFYPGADSSDLQHKKLVERLSQAQHMGVFGVAAYQVMT